MTVIATTTKRSRERYTRVQTGRQNKQADNKYTDGWAYRQINRWTFIHTDKQTDKQGGKDGPGNT